MYRLFIITSAVLLLFAVSCVEAPQAVEVSCSEMTFAVTGDAETKGLVTGTALVDAATGNRPLVISSYLTPQSGTPGNYFVGETFTKAADGYWHHDPALYWPMEGRLDILTYSVSTPFQEADVTWGPASAASSVRLVVDESRTQDDVLYGSAWRDGFGATTSLSMKHSQAWIDVRVKKASGVTKVVKVISVVLKDTYIGGDLTIENNYGVPRAEWNFRRFTARDVVVDDLSGVYGAALNTTERSVGMLVPVQEQKAIVVTYTVDGVQKTAERALPHTSWLAGQQYVYSFVFNPS